MLIEEHLNKNNILISYSEERWLKIHKKAINWFSDIPPLEQPHVSLLESVSNEWETPQPLAREEGGCQGSNKKEKPMQEDKKRKS